MNLFKHSSKIDWITPYRVPIYTYRKAPRIKKWLFFKRNSKKLKGVKMK